MDQAENKMEKLEFGEWKLERLLGSGAFGKVLLMINRQTGEKIAVKKIHRDSPFVADNNWDKELDILHHLKHQGIVASLPVPPDLRSLSCDAPILCMEYCNGGDLRQVLNKPANCCGIPEKDVLDILRDISSAVVYLHSVKVVHRDIKPENVVIQQTEEKKFYKLIDLGMAKNLNKQSLCHTLVGTLQYLAPELFSCEKYNNTVDYWSLGVVIHECITGVRPFLPGQPPVVWMQHAERKTHSDICIYSHPSGEIVFSQKLFKENHLSSVVQAQMEEWLKLMLEWNPAMRGRHWVPDASRPPGPIVAFGLLEKVLTTEVVSIFWVEGLALLSYIVSDDNVTMETIHEWIERDTGISPRYQLLVLPRGYASDSGKSARQFFGSEELGNVCLFSKFNDGSECKLTQVYPEFLETMLANPREEFEYRIQKRMWAQSVFFINHQSTLYRKLNHALKIHSTYMTVRASLLKQQTDFINGALRHAVSRHDLFTSSLKQDQYNYKLQAQRGGLPSCTLLEKWNKEEFTLSNKLAELQSRCTTLEQVVQRTVSGVAEAAKLAGVFLAKPSVALDNCSQLALELYSDLQKRSAEQKQQMENNVAMTKVVVKAFKNRSQLFTDCFTQIRVVEKASADVDSFLPQLIVLKNEIDQFQDQIFVFQTSRQNDVWTLLERAVTLWQRTSMINQPHAASEPSLLNIPSLSLREDEARESMVVIQENQSLRYQIQDTLSRGLSATCNPTPHRIDWNFLND